VGLWCGVLYCVAVWKWVSSHTAKQCNTLQHAALKPLQHTATHCPTLQHCAALPSMISSHGHRCVCCSVLQCGAVCCIVLQCGNGFLVTLQESAIRCNTLRRSDTAPHCRALVSSHGHRCVCCNVVQCVAVCCSMLHVCVAAWCRVLQCGNGFRVTLQHTATRCNTLQRSHTAPHCRALVSSHGHRCLCCSVVQCVAVCCSVLQCVAVCCSVLQCVAVIKKFDFRHIYVYTFWSQISFFLSRTATYSNTLQHTATHCNAQTCLFHTSLPTSVFCSWVSFIGLF